MSTQLIPTASNKPLPVYARVFSDFLASLHERESTETLRSMHVAEWTIVPFERMIADGSWMLLIVTAKKYGKSVTTRDEVRSVARIVNRLFSTGLLLSYQTPMKASEAFIHQVVGAINLAVGIGYRPGHTLSNLAWRGLMSGNTQLAIVELSSKRVSTAGSLSAFWGPPVYLFMADCFRSAKLLGETSKLRLSQYRAGNAIAEIVDKNKGVDKHDLGLRARYFEDLAIDHQINYLDPMSKIDWGDGYSPFMTKCVLGLTTIIDSYELNLSTILAVPIDFLFLNRSILFMRHHYIADMWVKARIMQAVGINAKELHAYDLKRDYAKTVNHLGREVVIQKVIEIALSRGTQWNAQQIECFRELVANKLDQLKPR